MSANTITDQSNRIRSALAAARRAAVPFGVVYALAIVGTSLVAASGSSEPVAAFEGMVLFAAYYGLVPSLLVTSYILGRDRRAE